MEMGTFGEVGGVSGAMRGVLAHGNPSFKARPICAKRKKCELENQDNAYVPDIKKRVRTSDALLPSDRLLKKSVIGLLMQEGVHCFDRSCSDYIPEIIQMEREKERQVHVDENYLVRAKEITPQDRLNVLNEIAQIHMVEKTSAETIFLATSLFDRYLSRTLWLPRRQAITLSLASFFIACKYDQYPIILTFHLKQFSVSLAELLEMEKRVLKTLDWDLSVPTSLNFLRVYTKLDAANDEGLFLLSKYLLELSHREYSMMKFYPSKIAASVLMVANKMLYRNSWPSELAEFTGYAERDLIYPANIIIPILRKESTAIPCTPTTKKYSRSAYANVVPFALASSDLSF
eukprot:CAMPEP_0201512324 /NCGR_PEP_ID=MMETSP0161_2-20130828/4606_1 /ASSEMBLY_ACC=CAM_ASM_000251 /TAXON_ID=180227 /ORGANISM="Neoparamoeba aestuarina, Strain SoJaBio B1-5/56/2" /LENGTH=345 /DNA_ID=CAMNT_0047908139 /DNA_START=44 /DNA_END=1081 /DNA_ORIENTATION=+